MARCQPCGNQLFYPLKFHLRQFQPGLALIERGDLGVKKFDLVFDVLYGELEFPALASCPRFDATHGRYGCHQIRLCGIDRCLFDGNDDLVGLPVEFDEEISCTDAVIIVDENSGYLPRNASGNEGYVTIHIGIICRDGVESFLNPWNAKRGGDCQKEAA